MKKPIIIGLTIFLAFSAFSFFSNSWNRTLFEGEADSLLQAARDLTPETAPGLLLNKAEQFGINLLEEDIQFEVHEADVSTQISSKLERSGLKTVTYQATLNFTFTQPFLGIPRSYSYSKSRNFTLSADPPPPVPGNIDPFEESP